MKNKALLTLNAIALFVALTFTGHFCVAQCTMPPAKPGTIMGNYKACPNETIDYVIDAVPTTDTYTWDLPAGVTISGMNPYTTTDTAVTIDYGAGFVPPGVVSVYATNACGNSGIRMKTIIGYAPTAPGYITGEATACDGDTIPYSVVQVQSNTYTWSVPGSMSVSSGQGTSTAMIAFNAGFTTNGTISVTTTNGCGNTSTASTKKIFKANPPALPTQINGPDVACPNDTKTYSVDSLDGGTCNWTVPPGAILVGQGDTTIQVTFPAGFIQGTITCQYVNNCGSSSKRALTVRATPTAPGLIIGPASGICNTTQTYSVAPILGATNYTWGAPAGATIVSGQGTNSVDIMFPASVNGLITVNSTNSCGTSADRTLAVTGDIVIAQQPVSQAVCQLDTTTFSVTVPGGGLSFQWYLDGSPLSDGADFSGTQTTTLTILGVDSLNGGAYTVVVTSTCAPSVTSSAADLIVNMKPPVPSDITAPAYICPGDMNVPLSVLAGGYNTTGHFWELVNDGVITSGQGTNAITADFFATIYSGYQIFCWAENGCGLSLDTSRKWVRYSLSTPKITSGPKKVCQNQTGVVYASPGVAGAQSYNWTVTPGISIFSGQGTLSLTVDFGASFTSGQVCLTATNPCFTTPPRCVTVVYDVPGTPGNMTGDAFGACNTTLPYSIPAVAGAVSYDWTLPAGATISGGAGTNSVMIDFVGTVSGNVCAAAVGVCTTGNYRCKYVRSIPAKPSTITPSTGTICAFQTGVTFTASSVAGATGYLWTVPSGATIVSGQGTISISVDFGATGGNVGVRAQNACGNSGTLNYAAVISCRGLASAYEGQNTGSFTAEAMPNPVEEDLFVNIDTPAEGLFEFTLLDVSGKEVARLSQAIPEGRSQVYMNVRDLSGGVYLLSVVNGDQSSRIRILKR